MAPRTGRGRYDAFGVLGKFARTARGKLRGSLRVWGVLGWRRSHVEHAAPDDWGEVTAQLPCYIFRKCGPEHPLGDPGRWLARPSTLAVQRIEEGFVHRDDEASTGHKPIVDRGNVSVNRVRSILTRGFLSLDLTWWYTGHVETTEDDARVAKLATALLADHGRADLAVTPEQVVRWRQVADAMPVVGPRRGGRGQRAHYLPTAPAAAAGIALALDEDRNLDRAVVAAFGSGAPVAEGGLRSAAGHVLRDAEEKFRTAYSKRDRARSSIPRPERVPLRHSRDGTASFVTDAILAPLLGEEPEARRYAIGIAIDEVAGETAQLVTPDMRRGVEFVMGRFTFAGLRHIVRHVDIDRWREACGWVRTAFDWASAADAVVTLTGQDRSALGIAAPLGPLARLVREIDGRAGYPGGYQVAALGLGGAALTWRPRRLRAARETTEAMQAWAPYYRAVAALAADLPESWRPVLGAGGAAYLATLPQKEQDDIAATIRAWREAHPAWSNALTVPGQPAIGPPEDTT